MKKRIALVLACAVGALTFSSCGDKAANKNAVLTDEIVELTILSPEFGRIWKDDNPAIARIEELTKTKLNIQLVAGGDTLQQRFSVLAASGGLPDIMRLEGLNYQRYADQDLFLDITDMLEQYAPTIKRIILPENWDIVKWGGKTIAIPYQNNISRHIHAVRQDWLDKLGMEVPKTLDEFAVMVERFATEDPDGNGVADTFGIGTEGGNASTALAGIFGAFDTQYGMTFVKDGKAYTANISQEYRDALRFINKLWEKKVIDPELFILKSEQARQRLAQGRVGSVVGWWSLLHTVMVDNNMPGIVPEASWSLILPAITGAQGKGGMKGMSPVGGTVHISKKTAHPERALDFLDFLLDSSRNEKLPFYGIEGVHWTPDPEFIGTEFSRTKILPDGRAALDSRWLDPLGQMVGTDLSRLKENIAFNRAHPDPTVDPLTQKYRLDFSFDVNDYNVFKDEFIGLPISDAETRFGFDLSNFEEQMLMDFITGRESTETDWDDYVSEWKSRGGEAIRNADLQAYNSSRGTNVVWGN